MPKLTTPQQELLAATAANDTYKIDTGGKPGILRIAALLQKRGLLIIAGTDNECLLSITGAGRALLSPGPAEPNAPVTPDGDNVLTAPAEEQTSPRGKLGIVVALLRRDQGAGLAEIQQATGWQAHSVRGAMSGALKKKLGFKISSEPTTAGRVYRIIEGGKA